MKQYVVPSFASWKVNCTAVVIVKMLVCKSDVQSDEPLFLSRNPHWGVAVPRCRALVDFSRRGSEF